MAADKVIDFQKEIVKRDVKLNQLRIRHEKPIHEMDSKIKEPHKIKNKMAEGEMKWEENSPSRFKSSQSELISLRSLALCVQKLNCCHWFSLLQVCKLEAEEATNDDEITSNDRLSSSAKREQARLMEKWPNRPKCVEKKYKS